MLLALAWSGEAAAAVTYQALGIAVSGTGAVSPAWPAHVTGDIALLFVESTGGQPVTLSTPAGFVAVASSPQATGTTTNGTQITVFWARATSAAMAAPTVANPGDHVYARIITYRGAIDTGNPWDITGGGVKAAASTTVTVTGVTTTVANTLIVQAVARDNDATGGAFSAETNASLTGITERNDGGTTSGNGGGFAVWDGTKAAAGATGNTTVNVTSSINAFLTIALIPKSSTRFYMQNAAPDFATVTTNRGAWNSTASVLQRKLSRTKLGAIASKAVAEASATNNYDVLLLKLVSEPITTAQTISGSLYWGVGSQESSGQMNAYWHVHAYVTVGDTDTLRGTLVNDYTENANEWTTTAVGDGPLGAIPITPVAISANDRIVIEVGYVARNNSTTSRTGTLWYGGTNATDLALNGDETTLPGWWEFDSVLFPVVALHHIRIEHNGGACSGAGAPAHITLKACVNAACTAPYYTVGDVTGINLSPTSAGYTWAPINPQTIASASGGINSGVTLVRSTAGTAALAITGTPSPAPSNAYECYNANSGTSGDCNLVFSTDSFVHTVPDHTSDSRQVVTLTSCKGSFASTTRSVKFWSTYVDPATGTQQGKVVAGTGNANCATGYSALGTSSASPTTLSLAFGAGITPQATFSLCYPDAGQVQLDSRYDGSAANTPPDAGTVILGNDRFIAAPHHFTLSNITCGNGVTYAGCIVTSPYANPGAANAAGAAFMKAGNPFSITVTAQNTNGAATPNFGKETVPEGVSLTPALIADPDLTHAGAISGTFGTFGSGMATAAFSFDEVGIMTLTAKLASASYLGSAGLKEITTPATGNIGRFTPDHFDTVITEVTPDTGGTETTCADGFTYSAQPFIAKVTARANGGGATQNYNGSYAKAVTLSDSNAVPGGVLSNTAILAADFNTGVADTPNPTTAASPNYTFTVAQTAPATINLRATENAGDGVSSSTGTEDTMEIRTGRLVLGNAHGSELLGLTIPIKVRYWTGSSYATNIDDICTMIPADSITMGTYTKNLAACETVLSLTGDLNFTAGLLTVPLQLSAPGAGNNGSVDLLVNVGAASGNTCLSATQSAATAANVPWLTTNTARATFGVYKGADEFIYLRENY